MPLEPDDTVCFCFHVSLRKVETFCRVAKPQVPSQISECLSAGTGCGWCVPMLTRIHQRMCGENLPWWRQQTGDPAGPDEIDAEKHKAGRKEYLAEGKGTPPPGAEV